MTEHAQSLAILIAESFERSRVETMKFKVMADTCPLPAWMSSFEGKIMYVNPAYENLTGFSIEELQKNNAASLHPEDQERILSSWHNYANDARNTSYHWEEHGRISRKDGHYLRCFLRAIKVEGDGFVGFTVPSSMSLDFGHFDTPLKHFFQYCPDLAVIADNKSYFIRCSASWSKLGYTEDMLVNSPYTGFIHPDDLIATAAAQKYLEADELYHFRNRFLNQKTKKYHRLEWTASKEDENGFIYATARDLGEEKM